MTPSVETHAGVPPDRWDEAVSSLGGGIFLSSAWAHYQHAVSGARPYFLLLRDAAGEPAGVAAALYEQSHRPLLSLCLRHLTLPTHPLVRGDAPHLAAPLLDACEALGKRLACATLRVDSLGSGRSPFRPGDRGYRETTRTEFVLDLTVGRDAAWRAVDKKQRERIRQLERKGLEVVPRADRDALSTLQSLRGSTQQKRAERGQGYTLAQSSKVDDALHEHLLQRRAARIFIARSGGAPVAAILFATFGGRAYSVFSGSNSEGYRLGAQSALYWRAAECFADEGFVELNRGGVPGGAERPDHPLHGIYRFKRSLGTMPLECRSGVMVLSAIRASIARLRSGFRGERRPHVPDEE
jgi:Acetyltransferase (GNAT) domain